MIPRSEGGRRHGGQQGRCRAAGRRPSRWIVRTACLVLTAFAAEARDDVARRERLRPRAAYTGATTAGYLKGSPVNGTSATVSRLPSGSGSSGGVAWASGGGSPKRHSPPAMAIFPPGRRPSPKSAGPGASVPCIRHGAQAVDVDHGQLVGRRLKDVAISASGAFQVCRSSLWCRDRRPQSPPVASSPRLPIFPLASAVNARLSL